jgi:hypothetical protein
MEPVWGCMLSATPHAISESTAITRAGDMKDLRKSVDGLGTQSYFTPEWAVAGSHVIEPTGPMMGPNAVADVMPLGGRQMSW